jgi:hypothetical protein
VLLCRVRVRFVWVTALACLQLGACGKGSKETAGAATGSEAGVPPLPTVTAVFAPPERLSQTGLYAVGASGALAGGVYEFRPQFELWSDGANKRRFVSLPTGTQIDTSDMDFWTYPRGTKLWKEFSRDNAAGEAVRVETRLLEKITNSKWFMTSFIWDDAQSDAQVVPGDGQDTFVLQQNVAGTEHDVPGRAACHDCHGGMWDKVLGFSALQLSGPTEPGFMNLERLIAEDLVTAAPSTELLLPGDESQVQALGYLHANCGHCHNPNAKDANLGLELWAKSVALGSMAATTAFATTIHAKTQSPESPKDEPELRVVPGDLGASALYWRLTQEPVYPAMPEGGAHMPLIGSERTDPKAVQLVAAWINGLE